MSDRTQVSTIDMKQFNDWMSSVARAAIHLCFNDMGSFETAIYSGESGAKHFAEECGYAIPDFTLNQKQQNNLIASTYSGICCIAYMLKPPVNAAEWLKHMRIGRDREMERRNIRVRMTDRDKNEGCTNAVC